MRLPAGVLAAVTVLSGQTLQVYSPLTRVDPVGQIVKADRGSAPPRHILSPGVPRNAYSSLRIVVELNKPEPYTLDIGQNPENAVKTTLYREAFVETANGWIPDTLEQVSIPYRGFPTDFRIPGQRAVTFWLDMWVDRNAPVDRVKVEPQLYPDSHGDWVVYPMEVRIQSPVVPAIRPTLAANLPPVTAPSDESVRGPVQTALCGSKEAFRTGPVLQVTGRDLLRRNVLQHMALAREKSALIAAFSKASGTTDLQKWCSAPATPARGPEWYLQFRDLIYRQAGAEN